MDWTSRGALSLEMIGTAWMSFKTQVTLNHHSAFSLGILKEIQQKTEVEECLFCGL